MSIAPLSPDLTGRVLDFLGVKAGPPTLNRLDALLAAYTQTVPWESAFRIVRRTITYDTTDCPRWPRTFWQDAMERGGGGTCFESNYAFFSLLRALGYDGYLTINNMRDDGGVYSADATVPTIGCHSAIMLNIDGGKWLADVGLPVYVALPIDPNRVTKRSSPFHDYSVVPDGLNRYQIERSHHPQTNCYTLIDIPVSEKAYRKRTIWDYGGGGFFLDAVIVNKVIGGRQWRFDGTETAFKVKEFHNGSHTDHLLPSNPAHMAEAIAQHFGMDAATLRTALAVTMDVVT